MRQTDFGGTDKILYDKTFHPTKTLFKVNYLSFTVNVVKEKDRSTFIVYISFTLRHTGHDTPV